MSVFGTLMIGIEFLDLDTKYMQNERIWIQNSLMRIIFLIFGFAAYRALCLYTNPDVHTCVGLPPNQVKLLTLLMMYEIGLMVNIYYFYIYEKDLNMYLESDDWDSFNPAFMSILNWFATVILWNQMIFLVINYFTFLAILFYSYYLSCKS